MKLPPGLLDVNGGSAKGSAIISSQANDKDLSEFGTAFNGNNASCYVLTGERDVLEVSFAFNPNVAEFVDIIIDGIRRKTVATTEKSNNTFRGNCGRVLYLARNKSNKRAGLKNCRMQVQLRDQSQDELLDRTSDRSSIGSIVLQLFRKAPNTDDEVDSDLLELENSSATRYPDFEELAEPQETSNHNVFQRDDVPSFQIGYIDASKAAKSMKDKILKTYSSEYRVFSTLAFHIRSSAELHNMGKFENVTDYEVPERAPQGVNKHTVKNEEDEPADGITLETDSISGENQSELGEGDKFIASPVKNRKGAKQAMRQSSVTASESSHGDKGSPRKRKGAAERDLMESVHPFAKGVEATTAMGTTDAVSRNNKQQSAFDIFDRNHEQTDDLTDLGPFDPHGRSDNFARPQKTKKTEQTYSPKPKKLAGMPGAPAYKAWLKKDLEEDIQDATTSLEEDLVGQNGLEPGINCLSNDLSIQDTDGENSFISVSTEIAPLEEVLAAVRSGHRRALNAKSSNLELETPPSGTPLKSQSSEISTIFQFSDVDKNGIMQQTSIDSSNHLTSHITKEERNQSEISTQSHDSNHLNKPSAAKFLPNCKEQLDSIQSDFQSLSDYTKRRVQSPETNAVLYLKNAQDDKFTVSSKRKLGMTDDFESEAGSPRKLSASPAFRDRDYERVFSTAEIRFLAAEERKKELQAAYQKALEHKEKTKKARQMEERAEQIERENDELQAKIAALYGDESSEY